MITKPDYAVTHIKHEKANYILKDPSHLKHHDKNIQIKKIRSTRDLIQPPLSLISLDGIGYLSKDAIISISCIKITVNLFTSLEL